MPLQSQTLLRECENYNSKFEYSHVMKLMSMLRANMRNLRTASSLYYHRVDVKTVQITRCVAFILSHTSAYTTDICLRLTTNNCNLRHL